jgi:formate hydrogenlyase subunit 4
MERDLTQDLCSLTHLRAIKIQFCPHVALFTIRDTGTPFDTIGCVRDLTRHFLIGGQLVTSLRPVYNDFDVLVQQAIVRGLAKGDTCIFQYKKVIMKTSAIPVCVVPKSRPITRRFPNIFVVVCRL